MFAQFVIIPLAVSLVVLSGCTQQPPDEKLAAAHKAVLDARLSGADTLARYEFSYAKDHLNEAIESMVNEKKYFAPIRKYNTISRLLDTVIMSAHAAEESTTVRRAKSLNKTAITPGQPAR